MNMTHFVILIETGIQLESNSQESNNLELVVLGSLIINGILSECRQVVLFSRKDRQLDFLLNVVGEVLQYSTNPYFEAGHEMFIRDFTNTVVRVVIRDSRLREADPVMGIVSVRLSEVFSEASSVTQMYAITEGVGFGK